MEYEGHKVILTNGYYDVYFPTHPNARKNGSIMLQILIAEKMIGRYLRKGEVVHHKDFNRLNNSPDNLMVFSSQREHLLYHKMLNDKNEDKYILYKEDKIYHCEHRNIYFGLKGYILDGKKILKPCSVCGKMIRTKQNMCRACMGKLQRKVIWPDRNTLKSDIRTTSFTKIGEKYGVTDNAVKKWCKSYNLPSRKSDINKISDDIWNMI